MKQHVSISRLHKLAERLKAKVAELNAEATAALSAQAWRVVTQATVTRAADQADAAVVSLAAAERLSRELARIRAIVATQNERLGINVKLGLQESLNRQLTAIKGVLSGAGAGAMLRDQLEIGQAMGDYGMSVVPMSAVQVQELKATSARLQREIFGLSDEVAEANATRIELELSEDVAALITG